MADLNVNFRFTDETPAESGQGGDTPDQPGDGGKKTPDIPSPATDRPSDEPGGKGGEGPADGKPKKTADEDKPAIDSLTDKFVDALEKTGIQDATKGTLLDGINKAFGRMGELATTIGKTPNALISISKALGFGAGAAAGTSAGAATAGAIGGSTVTSLGTGLVVRGTATAATTAIATTAGTTGAAVGATAGSVVPIIGTIVGLVAGFIIGKIAGSIVEKGIAAINAVVQKTESIAQRTAIFNPQIIAQNAQFAVQRLNRDRRIAERYGEGLVLSSRIHGSLRHASEGLSDIKGLLIPSELQNVFGGGIPLPLGVPSIITALTESFQVQTDLLRNLRGKNKITDHAFDPVLGFQGPVVDFAPKLPDLKVPGNATTTQSSSAQGQNAKIPNITFQAP